ncbi:hypothetical protein BC941DRAFT_509393, partial [Chlamydoabsidia padenii]
FEYGSGRKQSKKSNPIKLFSLSFLLFPLTEKHHSPCLCLNKCFDNVLWVRLLTLSLWCVLSAQLLLPLIKSRTSFKQQFYVKRCGDSLTPLFITFHLTTIRRYSYTPPY